MSDPRDPSADPPPPAGLPDDERPVPSDPPSAPPEDVSSHAYDLGPDPWDPGAPPVGAPPPAAPEPPPPLAAAPPTRAYGAGAPPEAFVAGEAEHAVKRPAFAVYLLFLAGLMLFGAPAVVGVIVAYRVRSAAPGWLQSHHVYQIRTFWIAVIAVVVGLVGLTVGVGVAILMALVVWVTLRCFVGMVRLHRGEPIYNPQTWIV